jgi:hypothetical protein
MWPTEAFTNTDEAVLFFPTDQARHSGARSLATANLAPNDARVIEPLPSGPPGVGGNSGFPPSRAAWAPLQPAVDSRRRIE